MVPIIRRFIGVFFIAVAGTFAPLAEAQMSAVGGCEGLFLEKPSADTVWKDIEWPYVSLKPVGKSEPFVPPAALLEILPAMAKATAREYNSDTDTGERYLSIFANGRQILTLEFTPNGYRELTIDVIEIARPAQGMGLETAAIKEILRRYPTVERLGFRLVFYDLERIISPMTSSHQAITELAASVGVAKLKVSTPEGGKPTAYGIRQL